MATSPIHRVIMRRVNKWATPQFAVSIDFHHEVS